MPEYPLKLNDGLALRRAETDGDIRRMAAFNKCIHGGEDPAGPVRAPADRLRPAHPQGGRARFRRHPARPAETGLEPDPDGAFSRTPDIFEKFPPAM